MDFKKLQKEWAKAGGGGGGPLPTGGALKGIFGLLGLGAVGLGAAYSMYNVEGGHRAILFNRLLGIKNEVFAEGTHFKIPWFEWPIIYDVRSKPRNISSLTGSKDLQMVNVTLRVLSKPSIPHLPQLYEKLGTDFDERVLPSIVNEVLKGVVAQFNASQLITQREQVSSMIKDKLGERAKDFHILLDDVSITHLGFGPEYTAAVEAKQVAAQEAERARFVVEKALQDKRSTIIKAEGEAHAARLISDAIRDNPNFLKLRKLEAARDIANTLSKSSNRIFLSSDSLLLNIYEDDKNLAAGGKK